ncbi:glycosyltransferase [Flavobacterium sp.]|uniref:glycosyltransferase n=1 Tax=Flavobacterium sp. TaxID=239 RepID=UPI003D6BCA5E
MLAIIVPYYKLTFFEDTLRSLASQTDKRFKVYIGDDASPENCALLLDKYKGTFDFVYKKFETNLGGISLVKQWERCIAFIGNEEWIMILGDDDFISPNLVESFYAHYEKFASKSQLIRFAKQNIFKKTGASMEIQYNPEFESASDAFYRRITGGTTITLSEYIFKRSSYEKYGFYSYPLAWHSDNRAWIEFAEEKPIYSINEAVVTVVNSELSISGSSLFSHQKNQASIAFYRYLMEEKLPSFSKQQAIRVIHKYENAISRVRKISIKDRLFLFPYYVKNYEPNSFKSNLKKIVKSVFNIQ